MLSGVAANVLESMFFTSILGAAQKSEGQGHTWNAAKLTFKGTPSGKLGIGVSSESARSLAANFLGLDSEEVSPAQVDEVIGELTNMIAGSFVSKLESDSSFALSHPELESSDRFSNHFQEIDCHVFELEDGFLTVWLEMNL